MASRATVVLVAALLMTANALAQTHRAPRTPWGDPDLQGTFTNKDEVGTPLERPREFEGRQIADITPVEVAAILKQRDDDRRRVQAEAAGRIGPIDDVDVVIARQNQNPLGKTRMLAERRQEFGPLRRAPGIGQVTGDENHVERLVGMKRIQLGKYPHQPFIAARPGASALDAEAVALADNVQI